MYNIINIIKNIKTLYIEQNNILFILHINKNNRKISHIILWANLKLYPQQFTMRYNNFKTISMNNFKVITGRDAKVISYYDKEKTIPESNYKMIEIWKKIFE